MYKPTTYPRAYVTFQWEKSCELCAKLVYSPTAYSQAVQWEEGCDFCATCITLQPIPVHTLFYNERRVAIFLPRVYPYNLSPCTHYFTMKGGLRSLCHIYNSTTYPPAYVTLQWKEGCNLCATYPRAYVNLRSVEGCDLSSSWITLQPITVHMLIYNQRRFMNFVPVAIFLPRVYPYNLHTLRYSERRVAIFVPHI